MRKFFLQAFSFFGISGIGWIMDILIYSILTQNSINTFTSNCLSSFVAITFVYLTSTKKIFINNNDTFNLKKKYVLYIVYQIIIITLSSYFIGLVSNFLLSSEFVFFASNSKICGKIIVTPFTMVTNFLFMKFLVEKI